MSQLWNVAARDLSGNRIGLTANLAFLVANGMRLFESYPDGATHPGIRIDQR